MQARRRCVLAPMPGATDGVNTLPCTMAMVPSQLAGEEGDQQLRSAQT